MNARDVRLGPGDLADTDIDDAEQEREEAIAERAAELVAERLQDDERVLDVLEGLDYGEGGGAVLRDVARFFAAYEREPAASSTDMFASFGRTLWRDLVPVIEHALEDEARRDAEREQEKREACSHDD